MRTSRFSEQQILSILQQYESGKKVADICKEHEISAATFYNWRTRRSQSMADTSKRIKELEAENARLKAMYIDAQLEMTSMKEKAFQK